MRSATCVSTGNGAWNNSATWSCGSVPGCGDSIVILSGHTVSLTANADYESCGTYLFVNIYGTLHFVGSRLKLPCNSKVIVKSGGVITRTNGGGNSSTIEICGNTEWNTGAGTYSGPGCMPPTWSGCAAALPVRLINFQVRRCERNVCLNWQTASEINLGWFELQRSYDGVDFTTVGRIEAAGFVYSRKNYSFTDYSAPEASSYYRLRSVDKDLSAQLSAVGVAQSYSQYESCILFPNPAGSEFYLHCGELNGTETELSIANATGAIVWQQRIGQGGSKTLVSPQPGLNPGLYICHIGETGVKLKLIIE
jgi:hypothetical protein